VSVAKNLPQNKTLPFCYLTVSLEGVKIESVTKQSSATHWSIDTISYGVQDLVYTRVFAMIIVKETTNLKDENPFEVHAFVCDSRYLGVRKVKTLNMKYKRY
jgi:hypothetical protein